MLIRNLSNRTLNLKDSSGIIYSATPYGDLNVSDALWTDQEFRRNLRLRIREIEVESVTAGSSAPTDATYITTSSSAGLSAEKVLGSEIIMKGTIGARPAASINGRLYYVTDSGSQRLTRDTGTIWEDLKHGDTHASGGLDPLSGNYDINARVGVRKNSGSTVGTRRILNFIEGSGVSITVADDNANEEVDVTIAGGLPTGFIAMYGSATPPTGWLACDGSAVSRTTYAALFAVVSTT